MMFLLTLLVTFENLRFLKKLSKITVYNTKTQLTRTDHMAQLYWDMTCGYKDYALMGRRMCR